MKSGKWMILTIAFFAGAGTLHPQETNEIELLKRQLQQIQENSERTRREQQQQIEALKQKLETLTRPQPVETEKKRLEEELAAEMQTNRPAAGASIPPPTAAWSPAQPITLARAGSAYMNISFDLLMDVGGSTVSDPSEMLELGGHDPKNNGFSLPNAEIALDGAVDPYFKAFANIVFQLDQDNRTSVELEEAYALSTALPENLQLKAGQFFAAFGRQNLQHPHQWAFVDQPLILNRTLGPDGMRNVGAQIAWLAPTRFYTEASLAVFNGQGETAFSFRNPGADDSEGVARVHGRATIDRTLSGPGDMLYVPRLTSSFELTDQQTLVVGVSAAVGPNDTGVGERSQIYGADIYWKWKPADAHAGFPFVSWQTEANYQLFQAAANLTNPPPQLSSLPAETLKDWGFYSQVLWGFKERWVAGLRGEYANGNRGAYDPWDVYRNERMRISPALTFYPSEFSKIRLQFNYDHGKLFGDQYSAWLQLEVLLGAHGAHKF